MPNPNKGLAAGEPAPDFRLLPALSEEMVGLADFRGQWVVLLFFRGVG
jgi:peroxiredoxin